MNPNLANQIVQILRIFTFRLNNSLINWLITVNLLVIRGNVNHYKTEKPETHNPELDSRFRFAGR